MTDIQENWEKEFDEKWHGEWLSLNGNCRVRDLYSIKSFIADLLTKARQEGAAHKGEEVRKAYLRGAAEERVSIIDGLYDQVFCTDRLSKCACTDDHALQERVADFIRTKGGESAA